MNIFKKHDKRLRNEIANNVEEKMCYLNTCPNARDIILAMIDPYNHKSSGVIHCHIDCNAHPDCKTRKEVSTN